MIARWTEDELARYLEKRQAPQEPPVRVDASVNLHDPFIAWLVSDGLPLPEVEQTFIEGRAFRADYLWRSPKLIVEMQGHRDHSTRKGLLRDWGKGNLAQLAGYLYLQFTPKQLSDGTAIPLLRIVLRDGVE